MPNYTYLNVKKLIQNVHDHYSEIDAIDILVANDTEANQLQAQLQNDVSLSNMNLVVLSFDSMKEQFIQQFFQRSCSDQTFRGESNRHLIIPDSVLCDELFGNKPIKYASAEYVPEPSKIMYQGIKTYDLGKYNARLFGISGSVGDSEELKELSKQFEGKPLKIPR